MSDIDDQIAKAQAVIDALGAKIAPLQERLTKKVEEIRALKEKRDRAIDPATMTIEQHLESGHDQTMVSHERAQKFFWDLGLLVSGFYPESNQRCLQIVASRAKSEADRVISGVETVLPYLRSVGGKLRFSVLDEECGAEGSYSLQTEDGKTFEVVVERSRKEYKLTSGDLREAVAYIAQNCNETRHDDDEY